MDGKPCRDCGNILQPGDRGCTRCALNVDAENMIDRLFWRRLVPGVIVLTILGAATIVYLLR